MGTLILVLVGGFVLLIVLGKLKGDPDIKTLSPEQLRMQVAVIEPWINRYLRLPNPPKDLQDKYAYKKDRLEKIRQLLLMHEKATEISALAPVFAQATHKKLESLAKQFQVSIEEAGPLLSQEIKDAEERLIAQGLTKDQAEEKAIQVVLGVKL